MTYRNVSEKENLSEEEKDRIHADNVAQHSRFYNLSKKERIKAASKLGPNWASILSGMGDQ